MAILSREEWGDHVRLRVGMRPVGLCDQCDMVVVLALQMSMDAVAKSVGWWFIGMMITRNTAGKLAAMALSRSGVSYEPFLFHVRGSLRRKRRLSRGRCHTATQQEMRLEVILRCAWDVEVGIYLHFGYVRY
ncbi:hypothetical protein ACHAXR_002011 [Thalassiosira sp. AJA248-18]